MSQYFTSRGKEGGLYRLKNLLMKSISRKSDPIFLDGVKNDLSNYILQNPSLKDKEKAALEILSDMPKQSEVLIEKQIEDL